MHTDQEKLDAAIAAMTKAGWPVDYYEGEPLLLSEGNLGVACFNAGYEMAAAVSLTEREAGEEAKSALVNDAERRYLDEVFDCLPDSMSDFLADFLRRLTPRAASPTRKGSSEWVPVGERLPEPRQKVLMLYAEEHNHWNSPVEIGYRVQVESGKWWWAGIETIPDNYITHWQPLPTPAQP